MPVNSTLIVRAKLPVITNSFCTQALEGDDGAAWNVFDRYAERSADSRQAVGCLFWGCDSFIVASVEPSDLFIPLARVLCVNTVASRYT